MKYKVNPRISHSEALKFPSSFNDDDAYDKELQRLNENRLRYASFKKERSIRQSLINKKRGNNER